MGIISSIFSKDNLQKVAAFGKNAAGNYVKNSSPKKKAVKKKAAPKKAPANNAAARSAPVMVVRAPSKAPAKKIVKATPVVTPTDTPKSTYTILGHEVPRMAVNVTAGVLLFAAAAGIAHKVTK